MSHDATVTFYAQIRGADLVWRTVGTAPSRAVAAHAAAAEYARQVDAHQVRIITADALAAEAVVAAC